MTPKEEIEKAIATLEALLAVPPMAVEFEANEDMADWFQRAQLKLNLFASTATIQIGILRNALYRLKFSDLSITGEVRLARAINAA